MKTSHLFLLPLLVVAFAFASCDTKSVSSPELRVSSYLYRTSAAGVRDTITLADSLQVGDTVQMGVLVRSFTNYVQSFVASCDTAKVHVALNGGGELAACLTENADPENGALRFQPAQVYGFYTTLTYIPLQSGSHRIDLTTTTDAEEPYSPRVDYFFIAVR